MSGKVWHRLDNVRLHDIVRQALTGKARHFEFSVVFVCRGIFVILVSPPLGAFLAQMPHQPSQTQTTLVAFHIQCYIHTTHHFGAVGGLPTTFFGNRFSQSPHTMRSFPREQRNMLRVGPGLGSPSSIIEARLLFDLLVWGAPSLVPPDTCIGPLPIEAQEKQAHSVGLMAVGWLTSRWGVWVRAGFLFG